MLKNLKLLKIAHQGILKQFLITFLPLSVLVGGVLIIIHQAESKTERGAISINESRNVELQAKIAANDFNLIKSDLMFLATQNELQSMLNRPGSTTETLELRQAIAKEYVSMSQQKQLYDQIRFLDITGKEIVRVNFNKGQPSVVPDEKLQVQAKRYWFKDTLPLKSGEVFVSPLDLNIERGKIEQPLKPMIRFGTPVFDSQGQKRGIVVLNYLGEKFIQNLQKENSTTLGEMQLLNADGYWLKGSKPENEWGFMYEDRKNQTFAKAFPKVWQQIATTESGQFQTAEGLFTFKTLYPLLEVQKAQSSTGATRAFDSSQEKVDAKSYRWKILTHVPSAILNARSQSSFKRLVLFYVVLTGLIGVGSWLLALSRLGRQQADTELQATFADLTAIIDNLADGLLVTNTIGQITRFNPALLKMFQLGDIDLKGKDYQEISQVEIANLVKQTHKQSREIFTAEVDLAAGRVGQALATTIFKEAFKDESRKWLGSVILIRDVTAEKEIDQMKTDFISTVSHELRTPLTSVLGFASIIKEKLETDVFPILPTEDRKLQKTIKRVGDNLNIIVSEAERLTSLINDVLDIAKMEAGKVEWQMQPLDPSELLDWATNSTAGLFETHGLQLVCEIEPGLPQILGDRNRLLQVLINLISNAVKFTEFGSVICRVKQENEGVCISVIDTGVGITPEDQPKVFEKFRQVGDTLTDKPKGTGLGLPICKQIVDHHGGRIWVESEPGKGSIFSFLIPTSASDRKTSTSLNLDALVKQLKEHVITTNPVLNQNSKTILVVDDDINIRELLRQQLETEGYNVREAKDGVDAIHQIKIARPDLILLDVMMPQINGFDVAAVLKNDPQTADIPIIILSIIENKERGYHIGIDRYLTKPIDTEKLLNEIGSLLSQGTSSKKVLVVDKNASTLKTISDVLQTQGYSVIAASDPQECINKARSAKPDMIIIDSIFSQEADMVKTLRFEKELKNVFFIMLSEQ
ncbi:MAG: response regulator [Nostoc sp. CmiVER01]|uniref:response regulator n=1 Tax=Nostoc sp. CmiVER01 TaxID=3075384 RepID=UPI002AD3B32A|nr:response regulator [Nostoc sp. CmiVER01]MDZ8124291.1 response regulator [Nostoc sp. CmiVER01]